MYDLRGQRGRRMRLYFREGVSCDVCWEQQRLLESRVALERLGVDRMLPLTGDALRPVRDAAAERTLRPPLSDPSGGAFADYGLPSQGPPRHTFVVVGPDGQIRRRADFLAEGQLERTVALEELARALGR